MKIKEKIQNAMQEGGVSLLIKKSWRKARRMFGFIHNSSYVFSHKMPRGLSLPQGDLEVKNITPGDKDILIAKRILTSFHKALSDGKGYAKPGDEDQWDFAEKDLQDDFVQLLLSGDAHRLADYLSNMHRRSITYGISNVVDYDEIRTNKKLRRYEAALIKDRFASFAELLNILPFEGPEQGEFGKNIHEDSDRLVGEIEKTTGIKIAPPEIDGGLFKLKLGEGYFDSRDIFSLYTAWRISQLIDPKNASVCEIGAGIGKVALYANRFNFLNYSIFDLPRMNVVQAWYLIKGLPDKEVVLYGEVARSENSVKILPYWEFMKIEHKTYDLTLNEDSFPEIAREVVDDYLDKIKKNTKKYLMSINQEGGATSVPGTNRHQLVSSRVIEESGGFKRIYRFPFMLRRGYAEELYEIIH